LQVLNEELVLLCIVARTEIHQIDIDCKALVSLSIDLALSSREVEITQKAVVLEELDWFTMYCANSKGDNYPISNCGNKKGALGETWLSLGGELSSAWRARAEVKITVTFLNIVVERWREFGIGQ
jgi:hypothetical protein